MTTFDARERAFEAVKASDQGAALRHLIHDAGMQVAGELTHQNGANAVSIAEAVLAQRKAGKGLYELDFVALGASEEQLQRIAAHQAERKELEEVFVAPVVSSAHSFVESVGGAQHPLQRGAGNSTGLGRGTGGEHA